MIRREAWGGRPGGPIEGTVVTVGPQIRLRSPESESGAPTCTVPSEMLLSTRSSPCIQVGRIEDGAGD